MRLKTSLAYAAAFTIGLCSASTFAIADDSKDPIKIVTNNWTSQLVLSNVVGQILHAQGDAVEYKSSDTQLQFTAIASGDIDFQGEVWEGSMAESFDLSPNYAPVIS
jgi:glycine betaine/proline transport system substrate-binding protein